METKIRTFNPTTPASLLWAHEIRRENIHLLNQLDSTRSTLSTTIQTTETLKQSISDLSQVVQELKTENRLLRDELKDVQAKLTGLDARVDATATTTADTGTRLEALEKRVGVFEGENVRVRERIDGFEGDLAVLGTSRDGILGGIMEEVREMVGKEIKMEVLRGGFYKVKSNKDSDPEVLVVPDSMPLNDDPGTSTTTTITTAAASCIPAANETQLSESTAEGVIRDNRGSDSQEQQQQQQRQLDYLSTTSTHAKKDSTKEEEEEGEGGKEQVHRISHESEFADLHQNGTTLAEYFSFASEIRRRLPPRKREGVIVEAFMAGLDDWVTRRVLEEGMDEEGWGWCVLERLLGSVTIIGGQGHDHGHHQEQGQEQAVGGDMGGTKTGNNSMRKQKSRKRRRCIPIVPVDEDDLLF